MQTPNLSLHWGKAVFHHSNGDPIATYRRIFLSQSRSLVQLPYIGQETGKYVSIRYRFEVENQLQGESVFRTSTVVFSLVLCAFGQNLMMQSVEA